MARSKPPPLHAAAAVLLLSAPAPALSFTPTFSIKMVYELFDQVVRPDPFLELMGARSSLPESLRGAFTDSLEGLTGSRSPSRNDFHYAIVGLPDSPEADRLKELLHRGHSSPDPLDQEEVLEALNSIVRLARAGEGRPPARGEWSACPECFSPTSRFDPVPPELKGRVLEGNPDFPDLTPGEWADLDRISLKCLRSSLSNTPYTSHGSGGDWWRRWDARRRKTHSSPEGIEREREYLAGETGVPEVARVAWGELGKESRERVMRTFLAAPPPHNKGYLHHRIRNTDGEPISRKGQKEIAEEWDSPRSYLKMMLADYIVGRGLRDQGTGVGVSRVQGMGTGVLHVKRPIAGPPPAGGTPERPEEIPKKRDGNSLKMALAHYIVAPFPNE